MKKKIMCLCEIDHYNLCTNKSNKSTTSSVLKMGNAGATHTLVKFVSTLGEQGSFILGIHFTDQILVLMHRIFDPE